MAKVNRQGKGPRLTSLLGAALWSVTAHVLVLGGAALLVPDLLPRAGDALIVPELRLAIPGTGDDEKAAFVALESPEAAALAAELPLPPLAQDLPEADVANQDLLPAAGPEGIVGLTGAPAVDQGAGEGRPLPLAWRRDRSTLRTRLTTGARDYQPSRERTDRQAASPQALRRERRTGVGDSARSERPQPSESAPALPPPAPPEPAEEDVPRPILEAIRRTPDHPGADTMRGEGPLDADLGTRAYDVEREGAPRDFLAARAASNEMHPGITDYATVAARGPGLEGRGSGADPGISPTASAGEAPAYAGWPRPRLGDDGEGTSERAYAREHLEIRRRVARVLRFPKRLALALEQGEAIVQFQVGRDGRVGGDVKLVKSAGFEEFDREAVDVVRRAAPFPHLPAPLLVRIRIPFDNPLVR